MSQLSLSQFRLNWIDEMERVNTELKTNQCYEKCIFRGFISIKLQDCCLVHLASPRQNVESECLAHMELVQIFPVTQTRQC